MSWLDSKRMPQPEVWETEEEKSPPSGSAGERRRAHFDNQCVEHAIRLGMHQGVLLHIGTGDGRIALELANRCPEVTLLSIDRSSTRIASATEAAERGGLQGRTHFQVADLRRTKFKSGYFDGVLSNEMLHLVEDPLALLNEMARVVKKDGAVLVRDLRRPSLLSSWWHGRWFGRSYSGKSRESFLVSVGAAYSYSEWQKLLQESALRGSAQIFVRGLTHMGIERPARESLFMTLAERKARREYLVETEGWRKGV
ncbi:MAG: class I SAM-dependent methyltransferase [Terriglobia bacterium]